MSGYSTVDLVERAKNHLSYTSPYGYNPTKAAGIAFVVVFAAILFLHIGLAVKYKYWIVFATLVPGTCRESPCALDQKYVNQTLTARVVEVLGWGGRLWSSYHVLKVTPFLMQIST